MFSDALHWFHQVKCRIWNPVRTAWWRPLHTVDEKVNAMRDQRLNDPDSFGDKIFSSPSCPLAGLVLGKAFEMVWKKSVGRKAVRADGTKNEAAEAALGIVFAVVSAGFRRARIRNCPAAVEGDCGQAFCTAGASQVNTSQISQSSLK